MEGGREKDPYKGERGKGIWYWQFVGERGPLRSDAWEEIA